MRRVLSLFMTLSVVLGFIGACGSDLPPHAIGGLTPMKDASASKDGTTEVDASADGCRLRTCASIGVTCGTASDGCGGTLQCGPTCTNCVPKTCADLGVNCGEQNDGCGGTIGCGVCSGMETCGASGVPSVCGNGTQCTPKTTCSAGATCGQEADGCGGLVACNTSGGGCTNGVCGGAGTANECGFPPCTKKTCADYAGQCGPQSDGCGGVTADCGDCTAPAFCGGGGESRCGVPEGGIACVGLQCQQTACDGGVTTTLTGTVFDPGGIDPIYNALVYVPALPSAVAAFGTGAQCLSCDAEVTGSPLVSTLTDAHGAFTLTNVPVGSGITLVIQIGRWRRVVTLNVPACTTTAVDASLTHLPRNQSEGDIPLIALASGAVDHFECLLERIGLDPAEFTAPGGGGRVNYFVVNGENLASGDAPAGTTLWGATSTLDGYDAVILPCEGAPNDHGDDARANLAAYANAGGRIFTTHFGYEWLAPKDTGSPWGSTGVWTEAITNVTTGPTPEFGTASIDTSFAAGQAMSDWLAAVANPPMPAGEYTSAQANGNLGSVVPPATAWTTMDEGPEPVELMSFDTPYAAATTCGRVVYADFHVSGGGGTSFPGECGSSALTNGERLLEFMLFDLSSCAHGNFAPPNCTLRTCAEAGATCGQVSNGCGGLMNCGTCTLPETCGGAGVANTCGTVCVPETCESLHLGCGKSGDGCGGTNLDCGTCTAPEVCGGGGPNQCGIGCVPLTCAKANANCGSIADGCGNFVSCGTCVNGGTCDANQCSTSVK